MGAIIVTTQVGIPNVVEHFALNLGFIQHGMIGPRFLAAVRIDQEMHFHPGPRALRERGGELIGDGAFFPKEILERNRALRGADGREHGRENLLAVFERGDFVAFHQRRPEQVAHGADEDVVADIVIGTRDLSGESVPRHRRIANMISSAATRAVSGLNCTS